MEVAGANRRWRLPFRYRGSRRESAVAQLFSLGHYTIMTKVLPSQKGVDIERTGRIPKGIGVLSAK